MTNSSFSSVERPCAQSETRHSFDQLHGEPGLRADSQVRCPCIEDLRDPGMLEACENLRFKLESALTDYDGQARDAAA